MSTAAPTPERWGPHADSLAVRTLSAMLDAERLPHALLITGPVGVGKRDLALRAAQSLLCESAPTGADGPCRDCRTCLRLHDPAQPSLEPQHADVELVRPGQLCDDRAHDERHPRETIIPICAVRRIERVVMLAPFEADRRILIIDPADALQPAASDAFLKTLEEPPNNVHFILVSAKAAELSETIRSRCRTLDLTPLPPAQLDPWLDRWTAEAGIELPLDSERRAELSRLARGRPGWLQTNLRDGDPTTQRQAQIDDAIRIANATRAERLDWSEQVAGRATTPQTLRTLDHLLDAWTDWWRDLWLSQTDQPGALIHRSQLERIQQIAALYDPQQLSQFLEQIQRTRALIQRRVNARLALDVLLLSIPTPRETV